MIELNVKPKYLKITFVILLVLLPWLTSNPLNELNAELPRQEDLTFYEINPAKYQFLNLSLQIFKLHTKIITNLKHETIHLFHVLEK